jgi:uncharacterized protein YraI
MQFTILALSLAVAVPMASAYPITGDVVNCRSGPSTSHKVIRTYKMGEDVKVTCQISGENVKGDSLWDKTSDGCYVADYYVKTGTSNRVTSECGSSSGNGGSSSTNGKISRKEILSRGQVWIDRHVPYSMEATYPDPNGVAYRTDCSGFVSMALHSNAPGYSTVSLPEIATEIAWKDLQPGDFVGTLGPGTGGANGHVTLFKSWVDNTKKRYHTLECRGTYGCVAYERAVGWKDGAFTSKPYKYTRVQD